MHEDTGEKEILTSLGKCVSEVLEQLYCTGRNWERLPNTT